MALPDDVSERLERRADRHGVSVEKAAADLLTESLAQDPFEFVGIVSNAEVAGAAADEALQQFDFGR